MDFGLSDEQRLLDDTRAALPRRAAADRARARAARRASSAFDRDAWKELAALGVVGCLVPGGVRRRGPRRARRRGDRDGARPRRGAAAVPVGACVMAPLLLARSARREQQQSWLPRLASGEARVAVAAAERVERRQDAGVRHAGGPPRRARRCSSLDGVGADAFLVPTGDDLWLVPADARRASRCRPLADARRHALAGRAALRAASSPPSGSGPAGGAARALDRALDVARVRARGRPARLLRPRARARGRLREQRRQFERPIASFQAVKHLCAEMAAAIEPARALVWYAAHAFDALPEEAPLLRRAREGAPRGGRRPSCVRTATEVHGGIGFTDACDLHFWFKRAALDRQLLGGPDAAARARGRAAGLGDGHDERARGDRRRRAAAAEAGPRLSRRGLGAAGAGDGGGRGAAPRGRRRGPARACSRRPTRSAGCRRSRGATRTRRRRLAEVLGRPPPSTGWAARRAATAACRC